MGVTALWLMYLWLASAIIASYLSNRKGYGEKLGLAFGLVLSLIGRADLALLAGEARFQVEDHRPVRPGQGSGVPGEGSAPGVGPVQHHRPVAGRQDEAPAQRRLAADLLDARADEVRVAGSRTPESSDPGASTANASTPARAASVTRRRRSARRRRAASVVPAAPASC